LDEKIINSLIDVSMKGEELEVDLIDQVITLHDRKIEFDVDPINKDCLVKGLDDIGSTLEKVSFIDEFEGELFDKRPWDIPS
jgi:3-isopropylmalate/(R)-2-methylmalate dehydratase small subunit